MTAQVYYKGFIDYVQGIRECRSCSPKIKQFTEFGVIRGVVNSDCKECKVKNAVQRVKEKNLRERPEKFQQCDECCNIWIKTNGNYCSMCGTKVIKD